MIKKTFMATIIVTACLFSLVAGMQSVEVAKANPTWGLRPSTPNQDKPIIVIETPENNTYCSNRSVMLNFTVIKPSSWNWTLVPFGSCANGDIESVTVNLNGKQEFQDYLSADKLNGGGYWNKSYSLTIDGLNSGINSLSLIVLADAQYINSTVTVGDTTTRTGASVPMNVTDTLYLISGTSSNSSANSILSSSSTEPFPNPTPSPTPTQPIVSILSPQNGSVFDVIFGNIENPVFSLTYASNSTLSWVGYSVDGANNVTIAENGTDLIEFVTSDGNHTLTLYANDTAGNWATPQTVTYLVNVDNDYTPTAPPSPTQQQTTEPTPPIHSIPPPNYNLVITAIGALAMAAIAVGLLVYFIKRRGKKQ